jgi:hypothetical protein
MSTTLRLGFTCLACLLMGSLALGQGTAETYRGELTVPFGEIPVRIVQLDDFLVFIDEENPDTSFVVRRNDISNARAEGDRVSMDLQVPIQDRSGRTQGLAFRLQERRSADLLARWHREGVPYRDERAFREPLREDARDQREPMREDDRRYREPRREDDRRDREPRREDDRRDYRDPTAAEERAPLFTDGDRTYSARHLHLFGSCSGTLTISDNMLVYESPGNRNHSRQWRFEDLREVVMRDPQFISVFPHDDTHYNLELTQRGMERATFERLAEAVAGNGRSE